MSGNLRVGGWEAPGLSHVAVPFRGEERGADLQALGQARGGGAGRTVPRPLSPPLPFLQVSPSDSTLKREFSLDLVVMATLLTKSSFRGGGWLTQKPRGLGEGVRSDGFTSRACFHTCTEAAQVAWTPLPPGLSGPLVPRPSPCECHGASIPSACGLDPSRSWLTGVCPALAPGTSQGEEPRFVTAEIQAQRPRLLLPRTSPETGSVPKPVSVVDSEQGLSGFRSSSEVRASIKRGNDTQPGPCRLGTGGWPWDPGLCPQSWGRVREGESWPCGPARG